jgi:pentatricopeptide repeat protein
MDKVEEVLNEMESDDNVDIDWNIYSTLANIYIKAKVLDKAESVLKQMENKMKEMEAKTARKDRLAYDHLISFHASLGNRAEVYRIWKSFELAFPKMTNRSYYCLLYSLVRIGDIEGAEDFLKKWESVKIFNDIRVVHVLLLVYIKKGWLQKAELLLDRVLENGVKPTANTWEILAEGYIQNEQFDKAMEAMIKSLAARQNTSWQLKSDNVLAILKHFEKQGDVKRAEGFFTIRGVKFVSTKMYNSLLRIHVQVGKVPPKIKSYDGRDNVRPDEGTDILINLKKKQKS